MRHLESMVRQVIVVLRLDDKMTILRELMHPQRVGAVPVQQILKFDEVVTLTIVQLLSQRRAKHHHRKLVK